MKMIVHVAKADAVENDHKSVMIRTFALFSRSVFPIELSWSLVKQAYLGLKEFWLSYRTKK